MHPFTLCPQLDLTDTSAVYTQTLWPPCHSDRPKNPALLTAPVSAPPSPSSPALHKSSIFIRLTWTLCAKVHSNHITKPSRSSNSTAERGKPRQALVEHQRRHDGAGRQRRISSKQRFSLLFSFFETRQTQHKHTLRQSLTMYVLLLYRLGSPGNSKISLPWPLKCYN